MIHSSSETDSRNVVENTHVLLVPKVYIPGVFPGPLDPRMGGAFRLAQVDEKY